MNYSFDASNHAPSFRPHFAGCVAKDARFAQLLEEVYAEELLSVAADTYRSLLLEAEGGRLSAIFDRFAMEEIAHLRLVGELCVALGRFPMLRAQIRIDPRRLGGDSAGITGKTLEGMLAEALRDEERSIDRYQTLMGKTQDRVARSTLAYLAEEEQRHAEELESMLREIG